MIRGRMKSWLRLKAMMGKGRPWQSVDLSLPQEASYPQAPNCFKARKMFNFPALPVT